MQETIEIPRLTGERAERYAARVAYVTAGPGRSLAGVGQKLGKSKALLERWSAADGWGEHAARYDDLLANLAAQRAGADYLAQLEDHRKRYFDAGRALYDVAAEMLRRLRGDPDADEGLTAIRAAFVAGADLEAHALQVGRLLEQLSEEVHE